jgi:hypothetical protein
MALLGPLRLLMLLGTAAIPRAPRAACTYPMLSLGQVAQAAPVAIVGDVFREQSDDAGGYTSTLRVLGVVKGRSPGPAVRLQGLGHLGDNCMGGPRLPLGGRYLLFLAPEPAGGDTRWSLVDQDGGVYQMTSQGALFPPAVPAGTPELQPIPAAELVRDVGSAARLNQAHVDDLVSSLNLAETIDAPPRAPVHHSLLPTSMPPQTLSLAIAAAAVMLAGLTYLLWRQPPRQARRP